MVDIIRVRSVTTGVAGSPYYTNLFFADDGTAAGADQAVDDVQSFWATAQTEMSDDLTIRVEGIVTRIDAATGNPTFTYSVGDRVIPGGNAGEMLPRMTQGLIRWNTGVFSTGRQIVGHTFVPGMVETGNTPGGEPTTALINRLQFAADTLIGGPSVFVVWSKKAGSPAVVTNAVSRSFWAVLRSRRD